MKINMGCGYQKLGGYVNVDKDHVCNPDMVFDIERTPWPFKDDSVTHAHFNYILEHVHYLVSLMKELHRVCAIGAIIYIKVLHFRSVWAIEDPTHVRFFSTGTFNYFSADVNREWLRIGGSVS